MSDTNKKSMQKSTVQKKMVNESIASYGEAATKKRRSAISIMGSLIGLVKPLLHIMLAAIILGTAGYLCAIFLTILAGQVIVHGLIAGGAGSVKTIITVMIIIAVLRGILHYAEQYTSTQDENLSDAKKQADHLTDIFLKESAASYQEISLKEKEGDTSLLSAQYTLLPVWAVRYDYRDSEYTFLMNGQTGKVAGNPPLSLPKLAVGFGLIATFLFIFLRIFTALLGGPVL